MATLRTFVLQHPENLKWFFRVMEVVGQPNVEIDYHDESGRHFGIFVAKKFARQLWIDRLDKNYIVCTK